MFQTKFYKKLISEYITHIKPPDHHIDLAKLGGPISKYLADESNNLISLTGNNTTHIIDIDITSAFPTLCNNLFNEDSQFLQTLNSIKDKKPKNIHIATTLKGEPLKQINQMCKLIILGVIFDTDNKIELNNILVLELKKDGCIISCPTETINRLENLNSLTNPFTNFINSHNFNFHLNSFSKYIRSNRTTFLLNKKLDNIDIKGYYKHVPIKLKEIMLNVLINNLKNIDDVNHIYTKLFFKIIQKNNIINFLNDYFICDKNKVIDEVGQYVKLQYNTKVNPTLYKKLFLHPLVISNTFE